MTFCQGRGIHPLGDRRELRTALSLYAEYRFARPLKKRWDGTTWNLHVGHLSAFYKWARSEGFAEAVPFTYRVGKRIADGVLVDVERNLARVRGPRPHTTIKYLEQDFCALFVRALGTGAERLSRPPTGPRVRADAAMGGFVLSSGPRQQEFTHLTVYEVPPLPRPHVAAGALSAGPGPDQGQEGSHDLGRVRRARLHAPVHRSRPGGVDRGVPVTSAVAAG
ncbi:hypothetical protein GCM10010306_051230 [Streptomyces umbrinus]|uniref:hypothetical protein n=1 Tax=Streptomyces umbrinus TaxID=67370 RepID=UPI0019CBE30A|nr:hypothetical protein [Streptomyces umbrinus]GHB51280.1 hypothetical protein GCM10010306_051230 [Streptomyces umbrinus]